MNIYTDRIVTEDDIDEFAAIVWALVLHPDPSVETIARAILDTFGSRVERRDVLIGHYNRSRSHHLKAAYARAVDELDREFGPWMRDNLKFVARYFVG